MDSNPLIKVERVSKKFCRDLKRSIWYGVQDTALDILARENAGANLRRGEFWALDKVSFELRRGDCVGLIGRNGAGKTTLLRLLNGLIKPDLGRIEIRGRVGALIALGTGFNPVLTGRENIYINGSVLGLSRKEIDQKLDDILAFAEIHDDFIDAPVQTYSSGMQMRLGFAIATALEPDVLLVDEVLAVGDFRFRWKCLQRIKKLREQGICIILVSHNSPDLLRTCSVGLVMENGRQIFFGGIEEALLEYEGSVPAEVTELIPSENGKKLPVQLLSIDFRIDGKPTSKMKSGQKLQIEVKIHSDAALNRVRIILGFFHVEFGALFHVSSFTKMGWISVPKGGCSLLIDLGALPIQFGSYYAETTIRGPQLSEFYGSGRAPQLLHVTDPQPNYEGFGLNGVLVPGVDWTLKLEDSIYSNADKKPL